MAVKVQLLAGERQKHESRVAMLACNDWLRMGGGRSLIDLWRRYTETNEDKPPTRSYATLKIWSFHYDWPSRADAFDAETERAKNEARREVMETGLALDFERIDELKRLFDLLSIELYKRGRGKTLPNLWLADVKQIGSGDTAERVDLRRFNAAIVAELRGVLDDLAKETGGRAGKLDLTTGGGQAVKFVTVVEPSEGGGKGE